MNFYTFAAANSTTADARKTYPAINRGQVARTLAFCLTVAAALIVMAHRQSHATESGFHEVVEGLWPQAHHRAFSRDTSEQDVPDALGSTAFFLKKHRWSAGEIWGCEVLAPVATGIDNAIRPFAFGAGAGVRRADGETPPKSGEAALLAPAGANEPHFLVTHNFKVIKAFNNSTSVALLGDRIAGGAPLRASWPVAER